MMKRNKGSLETKLEMLNRLADKTEGNFYIEYNSDEAQLVYINEHGKVSNVGYTNSLEIIYDTMDAIITALLIVKPETRFIREL